MNNKISSCNLLNDKKALKFKQNTNGVFVDLKGVEVEAIDTIIELHLK